MPTADLRIFDPAIARMIFRDPASKAAKAHRCEGDPTRRLGPAHMIQLGEVYEKEIFADDEHRTFRTWRCCHWCRDGEPRRGAQP